MAADEEIAELADACRRLSFPRGAGLPGRIWETGEAQGIPDVLADEQRFPRSEVAAQSGVQTVVAVPVFGRTTLLGVLELFFTEPRPEDSRALRVLGTIGRLLGEYLERYRAEERLAVSEALRAAMVNAALDCVITIDRHSRVVDFNPAAERTFGYPREQAIGADMSALIIPPAYREAHLAAVRRLLNGGAPQLLGRRLELEAMRADGSQFPAELTINRLTTAQGPLFVGFVRDITERRRAQDELGRLLEREHEARLRAERAEQRASRIAQTLQRSLLPPGFPRSPASSWPPGSRPVARGPRWAVTSTTCSSRGRAAGRG